MLRACQDLDGAQPLEDRCRHVPWEFQPIPVLLTRRRRGLHYQDEIFSEIFTEWESSSGISILLGLVMKMDFFWNVALTRFFFFFFLGIRIILD